MYVKKNRFGRKSAILVCLFLALNLVSILSINNNSAVNYSGQNNNDLTKEGGNNIENLRQSDYIRYKDEWLKNNGFDLPIDPWAKSKEGDNSDVNNTADGDYAYMEVLGDSGSFSTRTFEATPNATGAWWAENNSKVFPQIDADNRGDVQSYGINKYGWWAGHEFKENGQSWEVDRNAEVNFKRNYTTDVDLSDYEITSVYVNATINGSVMATTDAQDGGLECPGDTIADHASVYDYARFFIAAENVEGTHKFELAFNKTKYLGLDTHAVDFRDYMSNVYLTAYDESILIAYLEAIFQNTAYNKFIITLGIEFFSEDNAQTEQDKWNYLYFNDFVLNFTYTKKMDRYSAATWSQLGNKVPINPLAAPEDYQVDIAYLNFSIKIDKKFQGDSPNSEVRALINGNKFVQTIKIDKLNETFDFISLDLVPIIQKGDNLTTSIQITFFGMLFSAIAYYVHERFWSWINWGYKDDIQ